MSEPAPPPRRAGKPAAGRKPWLLRQADAQTLEVAPGRAAEWTGRRGRGLLGGLLLFGLAFLAGGLAISSALGALGLPRFSMPLQGKSDLIALHPDATVVFFGASTVFRAIDPEVVDASMAAAGCEAKSLNLAFPAISIPETMLMIERASRGFAPGTVFVLDGGLGFQNREEWLTENRRNSLTFDTLPLLLEQMAFLEASYWDLPFLLRLATARSLAMHQLSALVTPETYDPESYMALEGFERRGFVPFPAVFEDDLKDRREKHLRRLERGQYEKIFDQVLAEALRPAPAGGRMMLGLVELVERGGQRPVLLAIPALAVFPLRAVRAAVEIDPSLPLIDYGIDKGLLRYDDASVFFDRTHLLEAGARIVSAAVGRSLCALLSAPE